MEQVKFTHVVMITDLQIPIAKEFLIYEQNRSLFRLEDRDVYFYVYTHTDTSLVDALNYLLIQHGIPSVTPRYKLSNLWTN